MKKKYTLGGLSKMLSTYNRSDKAYRGGNYHGTPRGGMRWTAIRRYAGHIVMQTGCLLKLAWRVTEFGTHHSNVYIIQAKSPIWPKVLLQVYKRFGTGCVPLLAKGVELRCMTQSRVELIFFGSEAGSAFIREHKLKVDCNRVSNALRMA